MLLKGQNFVDSTLCLGVFKKSQTRLLWCTIFKRLNLFGSNFQSLASFFELTCQLINGAVAFFEVMKANFRLDQVIFKGFQTLPTPPCRNCAFLRFSNDVAFLSTEPDAAQVSFNMFRTERRSDSTMNPYAWHSSCTRYNAYGLRTFLDVKSQKSQSASLLPM